MPENTCECGCGRPCARRFFKGHNRRGLKSDRVYVECSIDDCHEIEDSRGWCARHYHTWWRNGDPLAKKPKKYTDEERFWQRVWVRVDCCWEWTAATGYHGYGLFYLSTAVPAVLAHRYAYELAYGPMPDDLVTDHLCRNRACVRPDHLEAVTRAVNNLRGASPAALNAVKTHCKRGHPFNEANTYVTPKGRRCRACAREYDRQRWANRVSA